MDILSLTRVTKCSPDSRVVESWSERVESRVSVCAPTGPCSVLGRALLTDTKALLLTWFSDSIYNGFGCEDRVDSDRGNSNP